MPEKALKFGLALILIAIGLTVLASVIQAYLWLIGVLFLLAIGVGVVYLAFKQKQRIRRSSRRYY